MVSFYNTKDGEIVTIEDGYAVIYDKDGFSKNIIGVKDEDVESLIEMMTESSRYEAFHNEPLTLD
jgi:hypothetical protein|tara:strand:+ start:543 stop:737 length:195 start_codon:yes stop_codon:yes gene_type:complete